jgi:hypothetical protein
MLAGANTNTSQQALPLPPGISYQQLLNVISAASTSAPTPPVTQAAALLQQFQLPSDRGKPPFM